MLNLFKGKAAIPIIIAIVVVGLFIFIYFIGRKSAKMTVTPTPLPADQPNGYLLTDADKAKVNSIATALHDDMNGVAWGIFHESTPYENLLQSSDTVFVAVYNQFNQLFSTPSNPTLRDWLSNEYSSQWVNAAYDTIKNMCISRIDRLNLK
jgi:hypothetical protein